MIYFISDTHFYHGNIVNLNPSRFPFFERFILFNLSLKLKEGDIIYHLGDFTWHFNDFHGYLERWKDLKARKVLIMGNHDKDKEKLKEYFDEVHENYLIIEHEGLKILLSHYPAKDPVTPRYPEKQEEVRRTFFENGCDILIHGHVHWNRNRIRCACGEYGIPCLNVNVEWNNYRPVAITEIYNIFPCAATGGRKTS